MQQPGSSEARREWKDCLIVRLNRDADETRRSSSCGWVGAHRRLTTDKIIHWVAIVIGIGEQLDLNEAVDHPRNTIRHHLISGSARADHRVVVRADIANAIIIQIEQIDEPNPAFGAGLVADTVANAVEIERTRARANQPAAAIGRALLGSVVQALD